MMNDRMLTAVVALVAAFVGAQVALPNVADGYLATGLGALAALGTLAAAVLKPREREDQRLTALCLLFAAFAIGQAVQVSNGNLHPEATRWLTIGLGLTAVGVLLPSPRWLEASGEGLVVAVAGAAVAYQFVQLCSTMPGMYLRLQGLHSLLPFFSGLALCALLAGAGLAKKPWLGVWQLPLMLLAFVMVGRWLLTTSPEPVIDVFYFQRDGATALLSGHNPYELRYRDIYGNSPFYGEGLSVNGVLQFGYPYPPLSLLLALPGQVLLGDYRYSQLFAMVAAAALMAYAQPGRLGRAAAALMLFTPRAFFVLEQGWTDPFVTLGLSAVVFVALKWQRALPWVFGLFLAVKQYLLFAVPAAWLLLPRPLPPARVLLRWGFKVVLAGAAVTLPLVLWNVKEFWHDVVALQLYQPFRTDALSYLAAYAQSHGGEKLPTSLAFVAGSVGVALGLWRQPRTPAGFAATTALAMLGFFAFNKQAFCNYYAFVIGALCVAAAAVAEREP